MTLTPFDLFTGIITPLPTDCRGFHTLAVHNSGTRMRTSPNRPSRLVSQVPVHPLPCPVQAPFSVMIVDTLVIGELTWQIFPLTTCFGYIQHPIDRLAHVNFNGSPSPALIYRQQSAQLLPLPIA